MERMLPWQSWERRQALAEGIRMVHQVITAKRETTPTRADVNIVGTALASATDPDRRGVWRCEVIAGPDDSELALHVMEVGNNSESNTKRHIGANGVYTDIIKGSTVTLGGSVAVGNIFEVQFTEVVLDEAP